MEASRVLHDDACRGARSGGAPCGTVVETVPLLPPHARVLDAGCGAGCDALFMAKMGLDVTAIDRSPDAVGALKAAMARAGVRVEAFVADIGEFIFIRMFDFVNMQNVLHLADAGTRSRFIRAAMDHTRPGGYHAVTVVTDRVPPGTGTADGGTPVFSDGELVRMYAGWEIVRSADGIECSSRPESLVLRCATASVLARKPV